MRTLKTPEQIITEYTSDEDSGFSYTDVVNMVKAAQKDAIETAGDISESKFNDAFMHWNASGYLKQAIIDILIPKDI